MKLKAYLWSLQIQDGLRLMSGKHWVSNFHPRLRPTISPSPLRGPKGLR